MVQVLQGAFYIFSFYIKGFSLCKFFFIKSYFAQLPISEKQETRFLAINYSLLLKLSLQKPGFKAMVVSQEVYLTGFIYMNTDEIIIIIIN